MLRGEQDGNGNGRPARSGREGLRELSDVLLRKDEAPELVFQKSDYTAPSEAGTPAHCSASRYAPGVGPSGVLNSMRAGTLAVCITDESFHDIE